MAVQMDFGNYVKGGLDIFKANIVPCIVFVIVEILCIAIPLLSMITMFLRPLIVVNFLMMVKAAKNEGKPMEIGALFNFENAVDKIVGPFLAGLGFACCIIPGCMLMFTSAIIADKPGTPFMSALKAAFAFGKANLVPMVMLWAVTVVLAIIGGLLLGLGTFVTEPVSMAAVFLAYEHHKAAIQAAAAEAGVQL